MESKDETDHYTDMMPEGSIAMHGFRLLSFMGEDGKVRYRMHQYGDGSVSHLIGLLEMAKMELLSMSKNGE